MSEYLDFRPAKCKNCYRCLRECPVKAIDVHEHQAKIIADRCILCGHCTLVCPQNAKVVHSELQAVEAMLAGEGRVVASVAPSFVSSFAVEGFEPFVDALHRIGFDFAEETAVGARAVTREYHRLLQSGRYRNLISSACPAVCRMIQLYYPDALKYLAPVDSPMIAHCKMLRRRFPDSKIVFIGPCIAKKREAAESGLVDGVLTFEELKTMLFNHHIDFDTADSKGTLTDSQSLGKAKFYPMRRGIIKSFESFLPDYEYVAVDGPDGCTEALSSIDSLNGFFLEINSCTDGCINGPCSMIPYGKSIAAMADVRAYVKRRLQGAADSVEPTSSDEGIDLSAAYPHLHNTMRQPSEEQIRAILERTGKHTPEDELNCGACGYQTCRQKAVAVFNGYVDIDVCVPYMRERAESMSYEVIQNSPYGIVVMDNEFRLTDINSAARRLLGIDPSEEVKMRQASELFDTTNFVIAHSEQKNQSFQKLFVAKTSSYINQTISILKDRQMMFSVLTDITEEVKYNERLSKVKHDTLEVTDEVVKKQMRVAQEIASLLGETTAETKVALLKLKQTLQREEKDEL